MRIPLDTYTKLRYSYNIIKDINKTTYITKLVFIQKEVNMVKKEDSSNGIIASKEQTLKNEILAQYKSIRQFAIEMEMPYSSLMSALDKGVSGMAYETVISICKKLGISPTDFSKNGIENGNTIEELSDHSKRLIAYYSKLNLDGKQRLIELAEDFTELKRYNE